MPRSPCDASAGWTNCAGVPVEGLAHAGDDDAAGGGLQQIDGADETCVERAGKGGQAGGFGGQDIAGDIKIPVQAGDSCGHAGGSAPV